MSSFTFVFFEIGKVNKRHATAAELKHEDVASQLQATVVAKVKSAYAPDIVPTNRVLQSLLRASENRTERSLVGSQLLLNGLVVDGSQDAHIKRGGVWL